MKRGSERKRTIVKLDQKRTARGNFSRLFAIVVLLGSILALAGCGRVSLFGLLESEEPGDFDVSPTNAALAVKSKLTISGRGGFRPYTFQMVSGGVGVVDEDSGVYTAPDFVVGDYESAQIEGSDYLGGISTTILTVFNPLKLSPGVATIDVSQTLLFAADGGVATGGYRYFLNGLDTDASPLDGLWTFVPSSAGTYTIEVFDDLDNSALTTVTVVAAGELAINPTSVYVLQGGSVSFSGINVDGTAGYTANPAVGSFTPPVGGDATYNTAPDAPPFEGTVTITLIDDFDLESVTATVYVLSAVPDPLTISPSSLGYDLGYGETVLFTAAGGIPPYTFTVDPDDLYGTIQTLAPPNQHQALYTAPSGNTVDWVRLTDALGTTLRVKVKVKK